MSQPFDSFELAHQRHLDIRRNEKRILPKHLKESNRFQYHFSETLKVIDCAGLSEKNEI